MLTFSRDNAFEHLHKQWLKREPETNPFGTLEEPNLWGSLGLSQKVEALWRLCEWQLADPTRLRSLLKTEDDPASWRVDPVGWDKAGNTYFLFDGGYRSGSLLILRQSALGSACTAIAPAPPEDDVLKGQACAAFRQALTTCPQAIAQEEDAREEGYPRARARPGASFWPEETHPSQVLRQCHAHRRGLEAQWSSRPNSEVRSRHKKCGSQRTSTGSRGNAVKDALPSPSITAWYAGQPPPPQRGR